MKSKFIIIFLLTFLTTISVNAQSDKIKFGNKTIIVKGNIFNEIIYNFSASKNKYVAYYQVDKEMKNLIITEISYEFENGRATAVRAEKYTCPLEKIDKQNSYNIEMENEAVSGGKYWRLTLVSKGSGADNLYFQKQTITPENVENNSVNNLTVNISNQTEAEKWLKYFTK